MKKLLIALVLAAVLAFPSYGQTSNSGAFCGERQVVIQRLFDSYGEERRWYGLDNGNRLVELYSNTETGTWTLTLTIPGARNICLIGSGHGASEYTDRERLNDRSQGG